MFFRFSAELLWFFQFSVTFLRHFRLSAKSITAPQKWMQVSCIVYDDTVNNSHIPLANYITCLLTLQLDICPLTEYVTLIVSFNASRSDLKSYGTSSIFSWLKIDPEMLKHLLQISQGDEKYRNVVKIDQTNPTELRTNNYTENIPGVISVRRFETCSSCIYELCYIGWNGCFRVSQQNKILDLTLQLLSQMFLGPGISRNFFHNFFLSCLDPGTAVIKVGSVKSKILFCLATLGCL